MKTCKQCQEQKAVEDFPRRSLKCRVCVNAHNKAVRVDYHKARNAARKASGEAKARASMTMARYQSRTKNEILADRARLRPNGLKVCNSCKQTKDLTEYYAVSARPDGLHQKCKACISGKYRSRALKHWNKVGLPVSCVYCSGPFEHVDHFYPSSQGGSNSPTNLVPACGPCNIRKSARDPWEFLSECYPDSDVKALADSWKVF